MQTKGIIASLTAALKGETGPGRRKVRGKEKEEEKEEGRGWNGKDNMEVKTTEIFKEIF